MTRIMRFEHKPEQRRVLLASDGYAYDRPVDGRVWRMPHDGGTQTLDTAAVRLDVSSLSPRTREELARAF